MIGGAYGTGHVYKQGSYVGDTSLVQASIGLQLVAKRSVKLSFNQKKIT